MSCIRIFLIGASNNRGLVKGVTNGFKVISRGDSFWRGANKRLASSNVNGPTANDMVNKISKTATVEGVSDELLQWDPQAKVWYNPSTGLNKTATFRIMVRGTDWNRTFLEMLTQLSQAGEYISYGGYALTLTGVGAGVGAPLAGVGNGLNFAGGIGEAYFTNNIAQGGRSIGFFVADKGVSILLERVPGLAPLSRQMLTQNASLKLMLIEKGINNTN